MWALYLKESTPRVAISFGAIEKWSHDAANGLLKELRSSESLAVAQLDGRNQPQQVPRARTRWTRCSSTQVLNPPYSPRSIIYLKKRD